VAAPIDSSHAQGGYNGAAAGGFVSPSLESSSIEWDAVIIKREICAAVRLRDVGETNNMGDRVIAVTIYCIM
jgi:hypothetical protein